MKRFAFWRGVVGLAALAVSMSAAAADTLRVAVVPIVAQEGFLATVLAPFLAARGLTLELRATHGREVARAARRGEVDLVMMHERFRARPRLIASGIIDAATPVFANPIVLLAPGADPAQALAAPSFAEALRRIQARKACVLENALDGLQPLLAEFAPAGLCIQRDASAVGLGAVLLAGREGWYTLWGLHPFAMSEQPLRARVWPEAALLRPLVAAAVVDAAGEAHARAAIEYLRSDAAREATRAFRLARVPGEQAFFPIE